MKTNNEEVIEVEDEECMSEAVCEEAHLLIMNTIKPDAVRGTNSVIFEYDGHEYELETILEVVVFINKFYEGE